MIKSDKKQAPSRTHTPAFLSFKRHIWIALAAALIAGMALCFLVELADVPPRSVAPYLERRASGHNAVIVRIGEWISRTLISMDRGESRSNMPLPLRTDLRAMTPPLASIPVSYGHGNFVSSSDEAVKAIASARPGDVIQFLPGVYRFRGRAIDVTRPGSAEKRITVRAERLNTVFLEFEMIEGFFVSAPYWTFENLNIRGTCSNDSSCEHTFHVVGKASHFTARNNRITDFNAHFKINGSGADVPDHGVIEGNTISNRTVRKTGNPVTPIDIVAASHWLIRGNMISDFIKGHGDRISYGAFAKGAGSDNRFEQNVVLCEHLLRGVPGQRVGLSLGGGGTGKQYCRDKRCITEQVNSTLQSNLIAFCSDDGIYINRAATSKVVHNTLIDTGGIVVRFPESSADVQGNLVDGAIRRRNDGLIRAHDNFETSMSRLYIGHHPVRDLYGDTGTMNFQWRNDPPRRAFAGTKPLDLCGTSRPLNPVYGAFENYTDCLLNQARSP